MEVIAKTCALGRRLGLGIILVVYVVIAARTSLLASGESIAQISDGPVWRHVLPLSMKSVGLTALFSNQQQEQPRITQHTSHHYLYNWDLSTEDNHKSGGHETHHTGKYASIRAQLDYTYHSVYSPSRQKTQDRIIDSMLSTPMVADHTGKKCPCPERPWIVFTAGAMGSGKSWTIRHLAKMGRFPLDAFVTVDPDDIRQALPEFEEYLERYPERAGELTRKEAGYLAEIAAQAALERGQNVLVDGSLRDSEWYQSYFLRLRRERPTIRIGILHIVAPREAVFERAEMRAQITGRVVPHHTLKEAIDQVPKSVNILRPLSDFCAELYNAPHADDVEIMTEGLTWETFTRVWDQECPLDPGSSGGCRKTFLPSNL